MSVTVLGLRYSRMHEASDDDEAGGRPVMYIVSTSILCMEAMKMSFVIVMLWVQLGCSFTEVVRTVNKQIVQAPRETSRLVVPAFLYVIQDNLIVYALSCLDAATYQVINQSSYLHMVMNLLTHLLTIFMLQFVSLFIFRQHIKSGY